MAEDQSKAEVLPVGPVDEDVEVHAGITRRGEASRLGGYDHHRTLQELAQLVRKVLRGACDGLMPPVCLSCQRLLAAHDALCGRCWRNIHFIVPPVCDVLGLPLPFDHGERTVSAAALAAPPDFDRARAVAAYGDVMARLVHGFKYADRHEARHLFARWLLTAGAELLKDADMVVPVPMHRWRLIWRTFNQAAVLGRDVARVSGVPFHPLLLGRTRNTRSQVGLTNVQRRRNISGAFSVRRYERGLVRDKNILLIDDVITTGSTAVACARALKRAGAKRVDVLALAMVVNEVRFDL